MDNGQKIPYVSDHPIDFLHVDYFLVDLAKIPDTLYAA